MAALAERLALLAAQARSSAAEAERLGRQQQEARLAHEEHRAELAGLEQRLAAALEAPEDQSAPDPADRDRMAAHLEQLRSAEMDARLAVRTGEERVRAHAGRADQLESSAALERAARERRAAENSRRQAAAALAEAVANAATSLVAGVESSLGEAQEARDSAANARTVAEGELLSAREELRRLSAEFDQLRDAVHRDEVARAEQRLRTEALQSRVVEEYGLGPDELLAEYGPTHDVPADPDGGPNAVAAPYDRAVQTKRAAAAERQLALLGRVNPLALEEFDALTERHAFLGTQLEDLKNTRRDLLGIVKEVDDHIHEVFRVAYEDTAREFETVFGILFPGGTGRLELTAPDDLMATGIEVIARPAGKKVSRLSLLSGGERSLAAIALLVAIFRARPSPFYVLDEVEAALDDRNLQRLLQCLEGLRERSQLIIITHQKRTMEVADALYGVSMRGDGVSTVISQRLREAATA
jgi:chromosome segregation protein